MSTNMIEVKEISKDKDKDQNLDKNKEKFRKRIEKDPKKDIISKNNVSKAKDLDLVKISIRRNKIKNTKVKSKIEKRVNLKDIRKKESDHILQDLPNQKDRVQFHPQIKVNKNHRNKDHKTNSKKV